MNLLEVKSLSKSFWGVAAVFEVSFGLEQGKVHSVIGPNGAGKTTLFNLISGVYQPSSGSIHLAGESVSGMSPDRLARKGVSRTFQNLQVCMNMTACENVMLGAHLSTRSGLLAGMFGATRTSDTVLRKHALELMEYVGIGQFSRAHATELSFGVLKRLEIARALASKPKLLMLDEPAAGLNEVETQQITRLIKRIVESGTTVLLVEHDMKMVMQISDHIVVLNYGRMLAEGRAADIRCNPEVVAAYLGSDSEVAHA
jgi:branched-chain amino acid transport system ATP-binding protein